MEPAQNSPQPQPINAQEQTPAPAPAATYPAQSPAAVFNQPVAGQPLQPAAIYPNPMPAGPAAAVPAEDDQKDYVMAFLLSWLLGPMGADRFYLGYTKSAIVKLLTIGGLGLWAVIDVWRLAFGKLKDKSGIPLRGYEKNKSWTRALAIIHLVFVIAIMIFYIVIIALAASKGHSQPSPLYQSPSTTFPST